MAQQEAATFAAGRAPVLASRDLTTRQARVDCCGKCSCSALHCEDACATLVRTFRQNEMGEGQAPMRMCALQTVSCCNGADKWCYMAC